VSYDDRALRTRNRIFPRGRNKTDWDCVENILSTHRFRLQCICLSKTSRDWFLSMFIYLFMLSIGLFNYRCRFVNDVTRTRTIEHCRWSVTSTGNTRVHCFFLRIRVDRGLSFEWWLTYVCFAHVFTLKRIKYAKLCSVIWSVNAELCLTWHRIMSNEQHRFVRDR
jgi:hypothetical protein